MSLYFAEVTNDDTVLRAEAEMVARRQAPNYNGPFNDDQVAEQQKSTKNHQLV
jgi:hypothetical protein